MTNLVPATPANPDWKVTARLCSGDAFDYSYGFGYILFRIEETGIEVRRDGSRRVSTISNWSGLQRERGFLDELIAGEDGLFLDAGPVRLEGDLDDWQQFLDQLVRPPRTAIMESPGWRARALQAQKPVKAIDIV